MDKIAKFVASYTKGGAPMIDEAALRAAVDSGSDNEIRAVLSRAGLFAHEVAAFFAATAKAAPQAPAAAPEPDADAFQVGAMGERRRIEAIISSPEAAGREAFARHLALETDLPVAAALDALRAVPAMVPSTAAAARAPAAAPATPASRTIIESTGMGIRRSAEETRGGFNPYRQAQNGDASPWGNVIDRMKTTS